MSIRSAMQRAIRPSTTRSLGTLRAKSLINAVLFFAVFMGALPWGAARLLPVTLPLPGPLQTGLALVLAIAGFVLWAICLEAFSQHGGTPLPADTPRGLVTTGPFAYSRNPIMAGELAIVWAEFLYFESLGIGAYAVLLTAFAHWSVVHVEEPELRTRFGAAYEDYCGRVPRWMPRLSRSVPQDTGG
jgi:protein-S-isoprenylcysteine O-methyltransferase Ste14